MRHVSRAIFSLLAANIISTLNQRLLASILLTYHYNLSINCLYLMTFSLKPNVPLSNLRVAEKIQVTVSLNANVMPPNVCDTSTLLKEWRHNKVFSIKMGLLHSLHSVTESANSVSLTLRPKGLVKIQIGSPSETTLSVYQYLLSNKIQTDLLY